MQTALVKLATQLVTFVGDLIQINALLANSAIILMGLIVSLVRPIVSSAPRLGHVRGAKQAIS